MEELARLRRERRSRPIKTWKGYVVGSLNNRATDWLKQRARELLTSLDATAAAEDTGAATLHDVMRVWDIPPDDRLAFEQAWGELKAFEKAVLRAMVAVDFHVGRAATLLGVHRNTVRNALNRVAAIFRRHGISADMV
jgi:DNA-directed RNA polymerase specialized sigma24 family protein